MSQMRIMDCHSIIREFHIVTILYIESISTFQTHFFPSRTLEISKSNHIIYIKSTSFQFYTVKANCDDQIVHIVWHNTAAFGPNYKYFDYMVWGDAEITYVSKWRKRKKLAFGWLIVYLVQIFGEEDEYKLSYVGAALGNRIAKPNFGNIGICLILTSRELI